MSIDSETNRNDYIGNGSTATYSYTFRILNEEDLLVTIRDTSGVESTLTLDVGYTVSGVEDLAGGSITLLAGNLTSGYTLTIQHHLDLIQETDLRNQGSYFPEVVEDQFDRCIWIDQQQQDEIDRSVKLPTSISPDDFDATLPSDIALSSNEVLAVNATGDGLTTLAATGVVDTSKVAKSGDTMTGDLSMANAVGTIYKDADSSNSVTVKAAASVTSDYTVRWPGTAPVASKFLKYDGTNYVWSTPAGITSAKSADYTVTDSDGIGTVLMTTGGTNRTVTLPSAANNSGRILMVKKVDSGIGKVTLDGASSETIDGALTAVISNQQYDSMTIQCDGTGWHILNRVGLHGISTSFTPTGGWATNVVYTGVRRRVGDMAYFNIAITCSGAPASGNCTINMPSGMTIDTAKLTGSLTNRTVGSATILDTGTAAYVGEVIYASTTTVLVTAFDVSTTHIVKTALTPTSLFTLGNTDVVMMEFAVPIVEYAF